MPYIVSNTPTTPPRSPVEDYGTDVKKFNEDHGVLKGCKLGRTVGSDYTECNTHHAYVKHGVPALLRYI